MDFLTSIVILNYNTIDFIQTCIESIRAFTAEGHYELIVVDNGSVDGSVEWLKLQDDLKCIFNSENVGFPRGCNQGMEIATGTEIMLLNSDVIVTPRWHEQMIRALYSDDEIGAVGCVTNSCSNGQQIEVPYKNMDIDMLLDFAEKYNHSNPKLWTMHFTLVGFCFMFKRCIYDSIGGLDEKFSPGNYEDDDYSLRIMLAGYKTVLCRDTFIHHYGSGSFIKKRTPEEELRHKRKYMALLERNFGYFKNKWHILDDMYKGCTNGLIAASEKSIFGARILVIARNRLSFICYLKCQDKQFRIDYLTDNKLDYDLMHKFSNIYYCDDLLEGLKSNITVKYDCVLLSNTVSNYSQKDDFKQCLINISSGIIIYDNFDC